MCLSFQVPYGNVSYGDVPYGSVPCGSAAKAGADETKVLQQHSKPTTDILFLLFCLFCKEKTCGMLN